MATYYISNTGNDSNNGTSTSSPWQTLSKVNSTTFSAGDQILFNKGDTFYGSFTVSQSGTNGNPIIFGAYGVGADPIITGFTSISSWTDLGSNIWESTNTVSSLSACNMVTIGGINIAMGRYPHVDSPNGGYLNIDSHPTATSLTNSTLTGVPDWTGGELVIRNGNYTFSRVNISSQSGTTLNFSTSSGAPVNNGFFIQNHPSALDIQNEWYYNPSTNKIRIYSTSTPSNVKLSTIEVLVTINANYITFNNITFTGANSIAIYNWDHNPRWNNIIIDTCSFYSIGIAAIYTLTNYLTIQNCTIEDCNSCAICTSYGDNITISDNIIQNIGVLSGMRKVKTPYDLTNSAVSCADSTTFVVQNNTIRNVGYNGISFYGDSITIQNNFVDTFCTVLDDGGGIYTYTGIGGPIHAASLVSGNIVLNGIGTPYGVSSRFPCPGIYMDEGSNNITVSDNFIYNGYKNNIFLNSCHTMLVTGNTTFKTTEYAIRFNAWEPSTGLVCTYNTFIAENSDKILTINSGTNDIPSRLTIGNNIYAKPINNNDTIFYRSQPNGGYALNFTNWKTFIGQDANSILSTQTVSTVSDFNFFYNETASPKNVTLTQGMVDVLGTKYLGTISIPSYSSLVLMIDNTPVVSLKYILSGTSRILSNGNVLSITN